MAPANQQLVHLVRHGHDTPSGDLSETGVEQAEEARDLLLAQQLGSTALLLTSPVPRAAQTAAIIASGLDVVARALPELSDHIEGERPKEYYSNPKGYLSSIIERELVATGKRPDTPVVVVSHEPFIASLTGRDSFMYGSSPDRSRIRHGEVVRQTLTKPDTPDDTSKEKDPSRLGRMFKRRAKNN